MRRLFRSDLLALLSVVIFQSALALKLFGLPSIHAALQNWIDDPEMWCGSAIVLALWALLSFLRTEKRGYIGAYFAAAVLAISFKEMSYILPLLSVLVLLYEGSLKKHWRIIPAAFALFAVAYIYRGAVVTNINNGAWSNGAVIQKAFINMIGGYNVNMFLSGNKLPLFLASLFTAGIAAAVRPRFWKAFVSIFIGVAIYAAIMVPAAVPDADDSAWYRLFSMAEWRSALAFTALVVVAWRLAFVRNRIELFGYAWAAICYSLLLVDTITDHALYLCALGFSVLFAHAALDATTQIRMSWMQKRVRSNSTVLCVTISA